MPGPGDSLGGRYRLEDRIAAGGMGEVWRATDTVLGRPVAVKMLLAGTAGEASFRRRFEHEARAMAALRHPGVAAVYDYGSTAEGAFLVMARIDGQSLDQRLTERGRLSPAETMAVVAQAGRALHAAHRAGIVHRDVTPGNLIVEPDGNVVLVDFGVARSATSQTLTGARNVVGTACYIAPEQVSKQVVGPAADLYALGAVAYHCLTGAPPFTGDDAVTIALRHVSEEPPPLPPAIPAPVRELVEQALAKDPGARAPSAAAMAAAATNAAGGEAAVRAALLATEPVTTPIPRRPSVRTPVDESPAIPAGPARWLPVLTVALTVLAVSMFALAAAQWFGWLPAGRATPSPTPAGSPSPDGLPSVSVTPSPSASTGRKPPPATRTRSPRPSATSPSADGSVSPVPSTSVSPDAPASPPPAGPSADAG
ncbi:serine/threonine-protein kinase [Actinoplanes flavus]|uniref:non-specific serine/threonine protein kinase n=1 Tax=Actinoplanes flavus TaxID=2820290 RepID=A0ABS3UQM6_9ACTN|nr:serine/threonine-protein kinase [Actinoplanes flavus]MBO3741072.1 protein kinase [Actinoplanes flavus]